MTAHSQQHGARRPEFLRTEVIKAMTYVHDETDGTELSPIFRGHNNTGLRGEGFSIS